MRPGWGQRHPELARVLAASAPLAVQEVAWLDGALPLRVSTYEGQPGLPDDLITSLRCLVVVEDNIVVCSNADGFSHPWPGGRRIAGETHAETVCREVHEETGWLVDPSSLEPLGWIHLEKLVPPSSDDEYPHPDLLQVVYSGRASERDDSQGDNWSDVEGYELSSRLVPLAEAAKCDTLEPASQHFVRLLATR